MLYKEAVVLKRELLEEFVFQNSAGSKVHFGKTGHEAAYAAVKKDICEYVNGATVASEAGDYFVKIYTERSFPITALLKYVGRKEGEIRADTIGAISILSHPKPGNYICYHQGSIGTLGCYVRDENGKIHILSNNHVLSNFCRGDIADPILHPGQKNTGHNIIARVSKLYKIGFSGEENKMDCGLAELVDQTPAPANDIERIGILRGKALPSDNMGVVKYGFGSGLTFGWISSTDTGIRVDYEGGWFKRKRAFFDKQLEIKGNPSSTIFSKIGDSGSLLIDNQNDRRVVGLIFAGAPDGTTFATPIKDVLDALLVDIV